MHVHMHAYDDIRRRRHDTPAQRPPMRHTGTREPKKSLANSIMRSLLLDLSSTYGWPPAAHDVLPWAVRPGVPPAPRHARHARIAGRPVLDRQAS